MKIRPTALFHFLFWNFFVTLFGFAQSTDLSVRFLDPPPPTQVGIGEAFAVRAEVFHVDANSSSVVNEAITITLELIDPNGIVIFSHVQSPNPFPNPTPAGSAQLDNDSTATNQVIMQMPWTEASKWGPGINGIPQLIGDANFDDPTWTVTVRVSSPSLESITNNNSVSHSFTLIVPDLEVPGDSITLLAMDPITGELTNNILPNSQIQVFGSITNIGTVMTQPGVRFTVDARLFEGADPYTRPVPISLSVDRESVILPPSDGSSATSVLPGASINYVIPNLKLPADAVGTYTVQVNVDPADLATGQIIQEMDGINNNHQLITFTVGQGTPNLEVNPNSFDGDIGIFRGLDPIRIAFSIRNTGNVPVGATDAFTARVALSNNDTFSNDDFILREFNIGGIALGTNLRSNETIRLDWIQQLPDNFEGDYYLITDILNENTNARTTFPLQNTPVITMVSKGKGTTELVEPGAVLSTERPHASSDGMVVVYEQTGGNGIQQIFLKDMVSGQITRISNASVTNAGGNGDSLRPRISADGSTVVFHSFANDLIVGDSNGHSDVFVYKVDTQLLIRAHQSSTGQDGNGGSFYPAVSGDGNVVVFESRATNLPSTGETTKGRQIFLWNLTAVGMGSIQALTYGNGESRGASVDQSGNLVTFSSYATNLTTKSDTNSKEDVFLKRIDTNDTFLVSRTMLGRPADGGNSWNPKISGDGSAIVFQSSATNMVFGKGVSKIEVERSGAGYFGSPTATITDLEGTGAVISLQNALDVYGQIREEAIEILAHGSGYFMPQVTILPDPAQPPPTQTAQVNALLSHSQGEIYRILVDDVTDPDDNSTYSQRASENEYAVGGDMESREPSISYDGQSVVYATKSTNLQDTNITRDDGKVYYNKPGRIPSAQAILVGGIGEIEVLTPGLGYQNGFLEITDLSGSGSGAVANYEVDSFGRIASIQMINRGVDYRLETTTVSVSNPRGGSGFMAGALRFSETFGIGAARNGGGPLAARNGGGRVHRVEMIEHGTGYQELGSTVQGLESIIAIDGDGIDLDLDGTPDSKVDPTKINLDFLGGVYIEQVFDLEVLTVPQQGATLSLTDANKTITILFTTVADSTNPLNIATESGTGTKSTTIIRDDIVDMIELHWPDRSNLFMGPQVEANATGGSVFTYSALSGRVSSSNPSAISVSPRSNMLFSGSGFTRATASIAPPAVIYGFSEVLSGTTTVLTAGGRRVFDIQIDMESDDVYLFDFNTSRNQRVSRSTFGFPVNYLPSALGSMPSNRFPTISPNGRHVFFSSDAGDTSGLAFGRSNQIPLDNNAVRDILHFDRKTSVPEPVSDVIASLLSPNPTDPSENNYVLGNQIEISVSATASFGTIEGVELFSNGTPLNLPIAFPEADPITGQYSRSGVYGFNWTPNRPGTYELSVRAISSAGKYSALTNLSKSIVTVGADSLGEVPIVRMTEPVPGGFGDTFPDYSYGSELFINVEAYDPDGELEYVKILLNGQVLGEAEGRFGNTYLYKWTVEANDANQQNFIIQAIAKDNDGNIVRSGSLAGLTVLNNLSQPPTVRMDRVSVDQDGVRLRAIAGGAGNFFSGISRVQFFVNGVTIDALGSPTTFLATGEEEYELSWKPEKPGIYTFYAMAVGNVGDFGDHYVIGEPIIFEVTDLHLASFSFVNVPPIARLINPGPHTKGTARVEAQLGNLVNELSGDYRTVKGLIMSSFGYGYNEAPEVSFYGGGGSGATATALVKNGAVTKINLNSGGSGYPKNLQLQSGSVGNGTGLVVEPVVSDGVLTSIPIISGGLGYSVTDLVNIFDLQNEAYSGYGAKAVPVVDENGTILSLTLLKPGRNYNPAYLRVFVVGGGTGFEANTTGATIENGVITEVNLVDTGSGYDSGFPLSIVPGTEGDGTGFDAEILTQDIKDGALSVTLTSSGSNYTGIPEVILKGGKLVNYDYPLTLLEGSRVILQAEVQDQDGFIQEVKFFGNGELLGSAPLGNLTGITLFNPGSGFVTAPTITIAGGGGSGAEATAILDQAGSIASIQISNAGVGYNSPPTVTITPSNGAIAIAAVDTTVINDARRISGTDRYVMEWVPQSPGTYNISVEAVDNDMSSTLVNSDRYIVIVPQSASKAPTISLLSPSDSQLYSSGSKLLLTAISDDPDGSLDWVRFYVNGEPYHSPLSAFLGKGSSSFPYSVEWTVPKSDVFTFYAVGMDNSGNGVMSGLSTITSTTGLGQLPEVKFNSPVQIAEASPGLDAGRLVSLTKVSGGYGYSEPPIVEIDGDGQGASATAIIETDSTHPNYGQVTDFTILNAGTGYTLANTKVRLLGGFPKLKPSGETAVARLNFTDLNNTNPVINILNGGSGYISPPAVVIRGAGSGMTAVATIDNGEVTGCQITNPGTGYGAAGNSISFQGGFSFTEMSFEVETSDADGAIEEVVFYENGIPLDTDRIPPYEFVWQVGSSGYYDLHVGVVDNQGNKNISQILRREVFYSLPAKFQFQPISAGTVSTTGLISNGSFSLGQIPNLNLTFEGNGYHSSPRLVFDDATGFGAEGHVFLENGKVKNIQITQGGVNYSSSTQIRLAGGLDTILSPVRLELGKSLVVGIHAEDPDTMINPLGFKVFVNGIEDTNTQIFGSSPNYSFVWTPTVLGAYSIRASGSSVDGIIANTRSLEVEVFNDNSNDLKIFGLDYSSNGTSVPPSFALGSDIYLPFQVNSKLGVVDEIHAYDNGVEVATMLAAGNAQNIVQDPVTDIYTINWNPRYEGKHNMLISVKFTNGTSIFSKPYNFVCGVPSPGSLLPETSITSPTNRLSTTHNSMIRLEANASDPDGSLEGVQFYVNGVVQDAWSGILDFNATPPIDGQLLTFDDGTGKPPVTFEFDSNQILSGAGRYSVTEGINNQLNDLNVTGSYSGYLDATYLIVVDGVRFPNTFKWSKDGGVTFVNEDVSMTGSTQILENGLSIKFSALDGHELEDNWKIQAYPRNVRVPLETAGDDLASTRITRDALNRAIENQASLGLLSFFTSDEATDDQLFLYHKMDQMLTGSASVSGSGLTVSGGTIFLNDNDFEIPNGIPDNLIRRDHSYGLPFYSFGQTWRPGAPGIYYIYSVAMDTFSRNLVMSNPVFITATTGTGRLPQIELSPVTSPIIYNGTASIINLDATAYDPDGKIIEVSFFGNGRLLSRDSTVPYEATMDYNASGHYEVYAVVSDDDGNDITSTVQRIVVNSANETQEDAITILVSPPSSFLGGFSTITGNFKSPSGSYDPNIRIEGYVNGMFAGSATILPYTPPAPGQIDPGYSFEFQFPARKVGLSEIELVVINGAETRSMNSTFEVEHSPITDNVKFIESVYETMFQRPPALFELNEWIYPLEDGSMTKAQLFDELRCRKEFRKAVNIMLSHKTLWGDWLCLDKIMIEQEIDENVNGTPGGGVDDYGNDEQNAQLVTMNQVVRGQIELPEDVDYFYIESLNPSSDGELTISIDAGSPGVTVSGTGVETNPMTFNASGRNIPLLRGYNIVETPIVAGGGFWTGLSGQQFQSVVDLSVSNVMDRWYFSVRGNSVRTGYYTLRLSNPTVGGGGGMVLVPGNLDSPVMDFLISSYLNNQVMLFSYKNQYGEIGRHNPEEFFRRIFVNKYEQTPSPIQIARGAGIVQLEGSNQIGFLEDFALDNSVITVGPYNYTSELSIPNVPLDFAAFGETALVYCSLIGHAPTELEVAKLTFTPNYDVRCLSERAKMIMELPEYTARYGLSLPEIDFVGVENGRRYVTGLDHTILVEAVTLGSDRLSGTMDDNGSVRELDLFLNGDLNSTRSSLNINGYYEFTLPATLPSGEYRMEVVAKDSNGLQSRAERSIALVGETDPVITLDSPAQGTILQKGVETKFSYSAEGQNVTAYLEVDGAIRWKNHIAFSGTRLPTDNSTISIDDGTGRMPVIFEFDSDGLASEGNTTVGPSVPMDVSGSTILTSSGTYLGIEEREYLIEIDTTGSSNTFRWSTNGGANFNNSLVPIKANQPISLSSGVTVTFSSSTDGKLGDRWQIKAYPKNQIVQIHRFGTFLERVNETKHNLIRTINRVRNEGKLAIKADNSNAGMGLYQGSDPIQSLDGKTIILCHDGSYPIKKPVLINLQGDSSLVIDDCLPLSTSGPGLSGLLGLKLGECFDLCRPVIEVRVCAFNNKGHAGYSDPHVFSVTDPDRLSVELIEPLGRLAILRIGEVINGTITKVDVVDGGIGYSDETSTLTILTENGSGADLQAVLGSKGEIKNIKVRSKGSNYLKSDMILVSSPKQYRVGETISLMAKVNDPRGELSSVAFFANGINIVSNDTNMSDINGSVNRISEKVWQGEFTLKDENIHFISARALYGDSEFVDGESRDNGPACPPIYCGTSCEDDLWCGEGFWGWKKSWVQQHCLPPNYLCPPWFWGNLDYWPWPPPWMNMPAPSGALPILSYSVKPSDSAGTKIASPLDPVEVPIAFISEPSENSFTPGLDWLNQYSMFLKEKSVIKFFDGINETSLYTVSKIRVGSVETTESFSEGDLKIIKDAKNLTLIISRQIYVGSSINFTVPSGNQRQISSVQFFINGQAQNIITVAPWSYRLLVEKKGTNKIQAIVSYIDAESQVVDMEFEAKPSIGNLPEGQLTTLTLNGNALFSKGSELIARALFVDSDGNGKTVETVEFYLNGSLLSIQNQPPFFVRFEPYSTQSAASTNPPYTWELEAVGIDRDGNIITEIIQGRLDGFPLVSFPTASNMTVSIAGQNNNGQVIDGSPCTVDVVIQGQTNTLNLIYWRSETAPVGAQVPNPFPIKLYANGIYATESLADQLIPILDSGNNVLQLSYLIPYTPSFLNQAKADGSITLTGALEYLSPQPVVTSSVLTNDVVLNIKPPTPWVNYESSLLTIRNDLLGSNSLVSMQEVQAGLAAVKAGTFFDWVVGLTNKSSFRSRLDLMAAYHIINGKYYDNHSLFNQSIQESIITWNNNAMPVGSVEWYKEFINQSLQDSEYQNTFGDVPYLVGDFNKRNLFPYSKNRLSLIAQFMKNKWGVAPSYSQQLQASKKLVNFWLQFQPTYWEDFGRDDGIRDTPPRRDTIGPANYESGEIAVELVWQLASETATAGGLPWIFYTSNIRHSKYTAATALALLLQNNWDFDQSEVNKLSGYSTKDLFRSIIGDIRYESRYFLIWKFAEAVQGSVNWKKVKWFGYFNDKNFPWIFHSKLGWLYHGSNTTASMWLYSPVIESWIWTSNQEFPWIYLPKLQKWVFLNLEAGNDQIPSYIWSEDEPAARKWVQFSDL